MATKQDTKTTKQDAKAKQKQFYTNQRVKAEETGDQATVDKIYKKLGRKSHSVDADKINKDMLGTLPFLASRGGIAAVGDVGKIALGAVKSLGSGLGKKAAQGGARIALKNVTPRIALTGAKLGPRTQSAGKITAANAKGKGFEMREGSLKSDIKMGTKNGKPHLTPTRKTPSPEALKKVGTSKTVITKGRAATKAMAGAKKSAGDRTASMNARATKLRKGK